jgi:alpha-D-xyloside xylohydrolase
MIKKTVLITLCLLVTALAEYKQAPYASWAHSHWVWMSGKTQTQAGMEDMVKEYSRRGIPVGADNIDSSWTTDYSNFIWNTSLFPSPKTMINNFHQQNIRVIAWITSVIDETSSNYAEAK